MIKIINEDEGVYIHTMAVHNNKVHFMYIYMNSKYMHLWYDCPNIKGANLYGLFQIVKYEGGLNVKNTK